MKFNVLVKDVMKRDIKKVYPSDSIEKAAKIMKKYNVGSVLVIDRGELVGILTPSDVIYKYVASKKGKQVRDIMTKKIVKVSPNKTIEEAARLLVAKDIEKLPVFEGRKLIGIISSTDILKVEPALYEVILEKMKAGRTYSDIGSEFGECESCGNYSDALEEKRGVWVCEDCRETEE